MAGNCCEHCGIVSELKASLDRIEEGFVRQVEFKPVKALVYGLVGLILSGFVTALVAIVVTRIGVH